MPYLNLDLDYFEHRKTVRLIAICGPGSELCPIKLWRYVGRYHPESGSLVGYSDQEVENFAGWTGEAGVLLAAMLKIVFLERITEGYYIHDWFEHAGHLAAFKKRAKSAAKRRWKKYATSIAKTRAKQCPNLTISTIPNRTNQTKDFVLPDWLEKGSWNQYCAFRREIRRPLTSNGERLALARLKSFHEQGQDTTAIIEQSILNGWRGLFPLNENATDERSLKSRLKRAAEVALK